MRESLKLMDEYDRKMNIFELILKYSERGHNVLAGSILSAQDESINVVNIVLKEFSEGGQK